MEVIDVMEIAEGETAGDTPGDADVDAPPTDTLTLTLTPEGEGESAGEL